jgi:hypothetical protein
MAPAWDGTYYLDMAKSGIVGNPNVVAPFAYRPGMPFASRVVSDVLSVSLEDGFRIVVRVSVVCLLMSIFMLARCFVADYRHALMPMIILGLSYSHTKIPLFFYTLVDVSAYPLIVVAFWALITKRPRVCLAVSSIGLLFKEFMGIPWLLLCLSLSCTFWRSRTTRNFVNLAVAFGVGLSVILIPRLCIPVAHTLQFVDPINDPHTLKKLFSVPLNEDRNFNIMYATAGYWLPTLLLLTRSRFNRMRADLRGFHLGVMSVYVFLVLLLTMYGGANIATFVSYSIAVQAVVLALLFRYGVGIAEGIYVVVVMVLYNKTMLHIPSPQVSFDAYMDFYGWWSSRVTLPMLMRSIEVGAYVILAAGLRIVTAKFASGGQHDSSAV